MGGTRLEVTLQVVVPAAFSGLAAAMILGISRAIGETMIVAVAAGAGPNFTLIPSWAPRPSPGTSCASRAGICPTTPWTTTASSSWACCSS